MERDLFTGTGTQVSDDFEASYWTDFAGIPEHAEEERVKPILTTKAMLHNSLQTEAPTFAMDASVEQPPRLLRHFDFCRGC